MRMKEKKGTSVSGSDVSVHMRPMRSRGKSRRSQRRFFRRRREALVPEAAVISVRIPTVPAEVPVR